MADEAHGVQESLGHNQPGWASGCVSLGKILSPLGSSLMSMGADGLLFQIQSSLDLI